ncbi:unnamed protein product [Calicophoron daubneyi]|uniref:Uncharacterized protein n=1 Tax=Calicophoron daubneyi TaxID=300641 RepID=A0AAV2TGH7_CALDB
MFGLQLVRIYPRKPPRAPPFRDVTQGESNAEKSKEDEEPLGFSAGKPKTVKEPRGGLNAALCAESRRAQISLHTLHIDQRRNKLRPLLALEEASLNEEMREKYGAVFNSP